jgi:hypothetical protein
MNSDLIGIVSVDYMDLCGARRVAAVPCFPRAWEPFHTRFLYTTLFQTFENCLVLIDDVRQIQCMAGEPGWPWFLRL